MAFLGIERETLNRLLPGLEAALCEHGLTGLERRDSPAIQIFREHGGAALLVPERFGGKGSHALDAVRTHRALGARAPSLSIAATMHNFSVATFVEYDAYGPEGREVLRGVAEHGLYIASGFAEGRSGVDIFDARMRAEPVDGGYVITGSKKPCSLSRSMNILTAGVRVVGGEGPDRRAIALVPGDAAGIERRPFWRSSVLCGAESDELILERVFVPETHILFPMKEDDLDAVELGGLSWFQLLIAASYLGIASALVDRVVRGRRGDATERARICIELEGAMAAVEGAAGWIDRGSIDDALLARILIVRFMVQAAIERATSLAVELLGGMAFVQSEEVAYLLAASRAIAFHPPNRGSSTERLLHHLEEPKQASG